MTGNPCPQRWIPWGKTSRRTSRRAAQGGVWCGLGGGEQGVFLAHTIQGPLRGPQRGRIHLISPETRDFQGGDG